MDLFRELEAESVERLALASTLRYYDQREVLVREGETGELLRRDVAADLDPPAA